MDHAKVIVRIREVGIQTECLPLAFLRLLDASQRENRQSQVHPGFLEVRIKRQRLAVVTFGLGGKTPEVELEPS